MTRTMQESIQQLTEKIYREGIEKAEERGRIIIEDAAQKARDLVDDAEAKAKVILEQAEKKAAELKMKNEAEMRLSARQAMGMLKQRLTDLVIWQLNHEPVYNALNDTPFVQTLISKLMEYWLENFGKEERLKILLPKNEYDEYRQYLETKTAELLSKGITIEFSDTMQHGFKVDAVDQGFKISFTENDFEHYFRTFARPRIYKLLFGKEE